MNPTVKNILAVLAGVVIGGAVNMGIIMISGSVIPPPEGADVTTMEGLRASIHLFKPINFLMPFLAHALGTLIGAAVAAYLAASHKFYIALGVGAWFLLGGIMAASQIPAPMWFNVADLCLAYIPMGYLGGKWVLNQQAKTV